MKTARQRLTLGQAMQMIGAGWTAEPHIVYDPAVRPLYVIRRGAAHDGTQVFSRELMIRALLPLLNSTSYYKPAGEPPPGMVPRYTVGRIKRFSAYGRVRVGVGCIYGERECVVIPVRCEYRPGVEA